MFHLSLYLSISDHGDGREDGSDDDNDDACDYDNGLPGTEQFEVAQRACN